MASKRDLVEAHAFGRRRLVTAFVSGAPGGREVEPARPGRAIVVGVALGVLLPAGAAVHGVLAGTSDRPVLDHPVEPGAVAEKTVEQAGALRSQSATPERIRPCGSWSPAARATSARTPPCS